MSQHSVASVQLVCLSSSLTHVGWQRVVKLTVETPKLNETLVGLVAGARFNETSIVIMVLHIIFDLVQGCMSPKGVVILISI